MKIRIKEGITNDMICDFVWGSNMKNTTNTFGYPLIMRIIDKIREGVEWNPDTEDLIIDEHTKQIIMEDDVVVFFDIVE
jgi:hypothetical protein